MRPGKYSRNGAGRRRILGELGFILLLLLFVLVSGDTSRADFTPPAASFTATSPIVVTPSPTNGKSAVISCPTCGTGGGSVTTVSVATANGFAGTVATPTSTPVVTLTATATGVLKGLGGQLVAATAGTDFLAPNGNGGALTGLTWAQIGSTPTTLAGYGITDAYTKTQADARYLQPTGNGGSLTGLTWAQIGSTPTTLAGYGITDAYTKSQIDAKLAKLNPLNAVTAATTTALPLSPTYANGTAGVGATLTAGSNGVLTIDGYTPVLNDPVMVKNEATAANNGIYQVTTLGTVSVPYVLTRAATFDTPGLNIVGNPQTVINGTANGGTIWALSVVVGTVGVDAFTFTQFPTQVISEKCITFSSTLAVAAETDDVPVEWASYRITGAKAKVSGGGSFTYTIKIGGTTVTGLNAVTVNSASNVNTSATALNVGTVNDIISIVFASPSGTANTAYVCPVFSHTVN